MKTRGATGASGIECLVLKTTSTRSRRSASGTATWSQVSLSGALTTMFCARGCPKRSPPLLGGEHEHVLVARVDPEQRFGDPAGVDGRPATLRDVAEQERDAQMDLSRQLPVHGGADTTLSTGGFDTIRPAE